MRAVARGRRRAGTGPRRTGAARLEDRRRARARPRGTPPRYSVTSCARTTPVRSCCCAARSSAIRQALESLRRLRRLHPRIEHVLVGDGWCAFRNGGVLLDELLPPHREFGVNAAAMLDTAAPYPRRVVRLTEETTETLYRIGPIWWWACPGSPSAHPRRAGNRGYPRSSRRMPRRSWRCARTSWSGFRPAGGHREGPRPPRGAGAHHEPALRRRDPPDDRLVTAAVGRAEARAALADELAAGVCRIADAAASLPRRPAPSSRSGPTRSSRGSAGSRAHRALRRRGRLRGEPVLAGGVREDLRACRGGAARPRW